MESWKQLYLDHIYNIQNDSAMGRQFLKMSLIYIDNDDIPEFVINWGYTAGGSQVCTVYNNKLVTVRTSVAGLLYIERENIFIDDKGGRMGYYPATIYTIKNGAFEVVHQGKYEDPRPEYSDPTPGFDYFRDTPFKYTWNDEEVSKEEYENALEAAFDRSKAFGSGAGPYESVSYTTVYTPEEMIELLLQ
jgi:hypothetical protein